MFEFEQSSLKIAATSSIEDVRRILTAADQVSALSRDELLLASEIAYRSHDPSVGVLATEALIEKFPAEAAMHHQLATFLLMANDKVKADDSCVAALQLDADFEPAHELLIETRRSCHNLEGALAAARDQERHFGSSAKTQMVIATLLVEIGRFDDALEAVRSVNDRGLPTEESLLLEAELAYRLRKPYAAASAAERASRLWPDSAQAHVKFAQLLFELGSFDLAIPALSAARRLSPDNAMICHLLAGALSSTGDNLKALEAAQAAIALDPSQSEYWYMAAMLLDRIGDRHLAIDHMRRALEAAPERAGFHIALAHMLGRLDEIEEAVDLLERAEKITPTDPTARNLRLALLSQKREGYDGEFSNHYGLLRPMPKASAKHAVRSDATVWQKFYSRLMNQCRVIAALVLRDFRYRTIHSRLGFISVFIPQAIQIVSLGIVLSLFNDGRPPIGNQLFFFYATGVLPFYLFIHVVDHSQNLFLDNISVLQVPVISRLDLVLAMALTELLIGVTTVVVTFGAFALFSYGPRSDNQIEAVLAMLAIWLFALGLGLISAVMNNLYRGWLNGWFVIQRFLYVVSGIFFIPQMMPGWVRDALVWNPLLVGIEWFRTGFFRQYDPPWIDKTYVVGAAFATTLVGLLLERALRRRMRVQ